MVRENPAHHFWNRLLPHYRKRDWDRCLRELRPVLDSDEDALAPRMLYAGLQLAAAQPALALVQYETLLPLAVGQGDFFTALAVQKRLDLLHPAAVTHPRRYEILHRWFISLGRNKRNLPGDRAGELSEAALLGLDAESFARVAESCAVEGLNPDARALTSELNATRLVLYGRATWSLELASGVTLLEGVAEQGQTIAVDPGLTAEAHLILIAELPAEFLLFNVAALDLLAHSSGTAASVPTSTTVPAESGKVATRRPPSPAPVARPQLDPRFEPLVASCAPVERRRGTHIALNLVSGVASLGLVNTRVAPIVGRLVQIGLGFLELAFPRSDLRHLRTRLEGSYLSLRLVLGPDEPQLVCTGRVRWTSTMGDGPTNNDLHIEIEILALDAADRERLAAAAPRFAGGSNKLAGGDASPAAA